jgi:hypothetical protein
MQYRVVSSKCTHRPAQRHYSERISQSVTGVKQFIVNSNTVEIICAARQNLQCPQLYSTVRSK